MFQFVSYEGPSLPRDAKVRSAIHLRAMQHNAALRKLRNGYAKKPSRQSQEGPEDGTYAETDIVPMPPPQDPRVASITQSFPLLDFATPLTFLHLGFSNFCNVKSDFTCIGLTLSKLAKVPSGLSNRRLFSFIPSRYGHHAAITHATDSLVTRLDHIIRFRGKLCPIRDRIIMVPYVKALQSLQDLLVDEKRRIEPETLCAVELLGIFELLNGTSDGDQWKNHASGAAKLIELRGPSRFTTEFELSLFISYAGAIISGALLNGGKCFLAESQWQDVIEAAVRNDPIISPDQVDLVMQIWSQLADGPNTFREVARVIQKPTIPERRERLVTQLLAEQDRLKEWAMAAEYYTYGAESSEWRGFVDCASRMLKQGEDTPAFRKSVTWSILQGTFLLCCMIKSRLLFALGPSRFADAENTCLGIAEVVLAARRDFITNKGNETPTLQSAKLRGGLFMSEVAWMARAVRHTSAAWSDASMSCGKNDVMDRSTFNTWCKSIGRDFDE